MGGYNDKKIFDRRKELRKAETAAESVLWGYLRKNKLGVKFYRQYSVGGYVLDFYCPSFRVAVELDGGYHLENETRLNDEARTKFLEAQDIVVLRFWNREVFDSLDKVLQKIKPHLRSPS